jgi:hypothetical protein
MIMKINDCGREREKTARQLSFLGVIREVYSSIASRFLLDFFSIASRFLLDFFSIASRFLLDFFSIASRFLLLAWQA